MKHNKAGSFSHGVHSQTAFEVGVLWGDPTQRPECRSPYLSWRHHPSPGGLWENLLHFFSHISSVIGRWGSLCWLLKEPQIQLELQGFDAPFYPSILSLTWGVSWGPLFPAKHTSWPQSFSEMEAPDWFSDLSSGFRLFIGNAHYLWWLMALQAQAKAVLKIKLINNN